MAKRVKQKHFFSEGMGISLLLHGLLFLFCLIYLIKRPEPGGSGLVLDAFLVNGGDGFYQAGVPDGDLDFIPGKKSESAEKEERAVSGQEAEKPVEEAAPVEKEKIKDAFIAKPVAKKAVQKKKNPISKQKKSVKKPVTQDIKKGEGGSGTQAYGGAVGDAPGFGAGQGAGIGIGSGSGVGDMALARYFVRIRRLFQQRLIYPSSAAGRKVSGKAVVRFYMAGDGRIVPESIVLAETSGNTELDAQALKTVQAIPFLPEPPKGPMTIEIPIVFRVYH